MTVSDLKTRKADKPKPGANKETRQTRLRKLLTRKSGVSMHSFKRHSAGMTSDWLKRHAFSPIWSEQRDAFAAL